MPIQRRLIVHTAQRAAIRRRRPHRISRLCFAFALQLAAGRAAAQATPPADEASIARELFDRGKAQWVAGEVNAALPTLLASQELMPRPSTLMLIADSYEKLGRLASASDSFRRAARLATEQQDPALARMALTREAALSPRVPRLEVRVAAPPPTGLLVTINGVEVRAEWLNAPMPLDPGSYRLDASAPGYVPFSTTVRLDEDVARPGEARVVGLDLREEPAAHGGLDRRDLGFWIGAGGAASLAASAVFVVLAKMREADSDLDCGASPSGGRDICSKNGYDARNSALDLAHVATYFGVAGTVLVGTGLGLYVTAPSATEPLPAVAGLEWLGKF
jgi:hypothetical protein